MNEDSDLTAHPVVSPETRALLAGPERPTLNRTLDRFPRVERFVCMWPGCESTDYFARNLCRLHYGRAWAAKRHTEFPPHKRNRFKAEREGHEVASDSHRTETG